MTIPQFYRLFPGEDACLEHVMRVRFGPEHVCKVCRRRNRFVRIPGRRVFRCVGCSAQVSPCAGTIFGYGKGSLHDWFYAICVASDAMTVRELAAHLGVGFNTALRMKQALRDLADKGLTWREVMAGGFVRQG